MHGLFFGHIITNIVTRMEIPMSLFGSDLNDTRIIPIIYSICDIQCMSCTIIVSSVIAFHCSSCPYQRKIDVHLNIWRDIMEFITYIPNQLQTFARI